MKNEDQIKKDISPIVGDLSALTAYVIKTYKEAVEEGLEKLVESWVEWSRSWKKLMEYEGSQIPEDQLSTRIQEVIALWKKPMPSKWIRDDWSYIEEKRYRRGDKDRPKPEHALEICLFAEPTWRVTGLGEGITFTPVLNAISLANTNKEQREIDVLGILKFPNGSIPCSVEMKAPNTNHSWYAVVENLQHLKLIKNHPQDFLQPHEYPFDDFKNLVWSDTWGMVLAPSEFFGSPGRRTNSFRQAKELIKGIKQKLGVTIVLACFHSEAEKSIEVLFHPE